MGYVCDGIKDCSQEEDEINCFKASFSSIHCSDRSKIINIINVCNHVKDCNDESDEKFCSKFTFIKISL